MTNFEGRYKNDLNSSMILNSKNDSWKGDKQWFYYLCFLLLMWKLSGLSENVTDLDFKIRKFLFENPNSKTVYVYKQPNVFWVSLLRIMYIRV